jgi:hypothetical protein
VINVDVICKTPVIASDIIPPSVKNSDGSVSVDEDALKQFDEFCKAVEDEILRDFDIVDFTTSGSSDTSRYYTFFIVDDLGNRIVEFVIVLRLSDHERTRNADRQSMRYNARQLRRFGTDNSEIVDLNYVIEGEEYANYRQALDDISQKIDDEVEKLKDRLPKSSTSSSTKTTSKRVYARTQKQPYIPIHQRKIKGGFKMRKLSAELLLAGCLDPLYCSVIRYFGDFRVIKKLYEVVDFAISKLSYQSQAEVSKMYINILKEYLVLYGKE